MRGAPTRKSCDMCGWGFKWVEATQDILFGGARYSVCDHHAAHPISPREQDFGQAPSNGTATSDQSARQSGKDVTPQAYLVLGVIAAHPDGLTREEIYSKAGITNQAACARLNTLQERGLIFIEGERYVPSTRRKQQLYFLKVAA